jgi:uncharacterized membrane protein
MFRKFKIFHFSKLRLEAFSDAVFAIVMTLLILELKVPYLANAGDIHEVLEKIKEVLPVFYSWVVSFFFVGVIWMHHQNILSMATKSDFGVAWINIFLLFFICLLPFPTALMGEYPRQPLFVMFWGLTVFATTVCLMWFYYYNTKNYLSDKYNRESVMKNIQKSAFGVPTLYLAGAFLAWVSVYISFVIYALIPAIFILPLDKQDASEAHKDGSI